MKLIVGLGNPGNQYRGTRHNIGAEAVRGFAEENRAVLKKGIFASSASAKIRIDGIELLLAVPLSYMNLSGPAVGALVRRHRIQLPDLLVVHDDMDLEPGRIKLKEDGSAGGHNGLKSVIASLGSQGFCRLRLGIGRPEGRIDPADYVLSRFKAGEREQVDTMVAEACSAMKSWTVEGISKTMNMFNR
ncbi:MAG: aminoacyl-tRNA hydrolase [Deltaproteobacteria bacterium]